MLRRGLEPPQDYSHTPLKRTRLPVPPPEHVYKVYLFSWCGIVLIMSFFSRSMLSLGYRLVYFFARLRGTDADGATFAARRVAMKKVGKMIDTRTQTMARHICSNC